MTLRIQMDAKGIRGRGRGYLAVGWLRPLPHLSVSLWGYWTFCRPAHQATRHISIRVRLSEGIDRDLPANDVKGDFVVD